MTLTDDARERDAAIPDLDWRDGRSALADWQAGFDTRPAMAATRPHA